MSRGKFQSETRGRCQSKDNFANVEIIDLDGGDADVEIIDAPGPSHQGSKFGRKEATSSPNCVISIDDDDDEDDSSTDSHAETSGNQYGFPRNRYGLDSTSESESPAAGTSGSKDSSGVGFSDSEDSDCEILDDSSGSIRQEWERAHLRKTMPPDKGESTPCENVKCHTNKSFVDSFYDCFSDCSNSGNKFRSHDSAAACGVPNAESGKNKSKEKVSAEPQPWYEKLYGSFVPGTHQEEIRERVYPFCSNKTFSGVRRCSSTKGKGFSSDNVVGSPEKMVVEEEISKEADNGVRSPKVGEEIAEEAGNGARATEKMNVDMESVKEACLDIVNQMDDEGKENCEPSGEVESSLMRNGDVTAVTNKHGKKIGEESALVCFTEANTEPMHDACFVGERERHKESDEYRRAAEAEWASRQEQLHIQAEEAQRLKKRKKAEAMRALDMKKRQKQRLEEIRENQKKNEETLSLKEDLRAEVRKELEKMEKRYTDMASILRGLGIPVGGGLLPMPDQVKSAYKKALLKFHPDRVKTSDVHQQVKAEETFKFISRLKEKLLPAA
ncbi:Chaperone DnaJ-domain superfamily protein [Rhynchospora pubera]|uniref:Chaperone DnaJ-domain superfamily protein n=1 Tax=Rhynchospora pubera TaxID=906938 RepID=A0AAV8H9U2_9POAL|nr:Chaperone DnaJ-domain superfamily protein [Rhynchospora pubera]KAJ4812577.1 Chaperone DnaJ-domain superfamily protein [Rhynchospora pubera]